MEELRENVEGRIADDSCLFCGLHFGPGGGHYYIGVRNKYGHVDTEEGGVVIEHMSDCEVQICPECAGRIRKAGIEF